MEMSRAEGFPRHEGWNISFNPNWICLGLVARVVIKPAEALVVPLANTVVLGGPKFARLSTSRL